ncbi:MAG: hypothetical protein QG618_5, partial [Thermodesulfobacteriota bacterium]|nr:hypothetical protein [Thermodesulfobacteriota bacterium]
MDRPKILSRLQARNPKMKSVCNGVAVIGYRGCNGCNGFWTDTVKTHPDIAEDTMISMVLIL